MLAEEFEPKKPRLPGGVLFTTVRRESEDSDVPRQAPNARLIALLLPFWLEGLGDRSCRGEGGT